MAKRDSVEVIDDFYRPDVPAHALNLYAELDGRLDGVALLDRWSGHRPLNNEEDGIYYHVLTKYADAVSLGVSRKIELSTRNGLANPDIRVDGELTATVLTSRLETILDYATPCLQIVLGATPQEAIQFPEDGPQEGIVKTDIEHGRLEITRRPTQYGQIAVAHVLIQIS